MNDTSEIEAGVAKRTVRKILDSEFFWLIIFKVRLIGARYMLKMSNDRKHHKTR